ncbi:tetratricopeptide repeat protein [Argonema antarcticum]|uniref:tetratricopeptide repeat protein n=1 Tax=Argonema antarcticum TaxID=2942763 RepID=UPI00201252B3|nr:tetratricopeptide repeat protein [Argonema antarcticum]MCL1471084.1 tetratricopeptide repeat protein [Argonema antarcticum A004/B2]
MKINYWIACAIFSVGLKVFAAPTPPQPIFFAQLKPAAEISQTEREELQQLRQEKEIRDRVQTEVDRAFSRATTLINILLFVMTLFPFATALGVWLLRRSVINQIVSETRNELEKEVQKQLEAEVADEFKKQASAFQQEMQKLEAEFVSHLSQLQALFIDAQQEKDRIIKELSQLTPDSLQEEITPEVQQRILDLTHQLEVLTVENSQLIFTAEDYVKQGDAFFFDGRYDDALAYYDKALKIKPEDADIWFLRAYLLQKMNRYEEAIADYDKTIEIHPDEMDNWYYKACCYALLGNVKLAVATLEQASYLNVRCIKWAKENPDFDGIRDDMLFKNLIAGGVSEVKNISGNTGEKNNFNEQENESLSLQAASEIPTLAEPEIETPQAENEETISANPGEVLSVDEYLEQGNVHFAEGRYVDANNCYNQALQIERDFPETRYQNARAYARRRNINPAIGNLQWAIDIDRKYKEKAKIDSAFDEMRENEQFQKLVDE